MKKCYKFILDKWACPACAADYRATLRSWIKTDGVDGKATLDITDDVYVYATDKDVLHMVITDSYWKDLPPLLDKCGSDILDVLMDRIVNRDVDDYDIEEEFLDYIEG